MSELPWRERVALEEIERRLAAVDPRLARRLARPGRWTRVWWRAHHRPYVIVLAMIAFCVIPVVVGITV